MKVFRRSRETKVMRSRDAPHWHRTAQQWSRGTRYVSGQYKQYRLTYTNTNMGQGNCTCGGSDEEPETENLFHKGQTCMYKIHIDGLAITKVRTAVRLRGNILTIQNGSKTYKIKPSIDEVYCCNPVSENGLILGTPLFESDSCELLI